MNITPQVPNLSIPTVLNPHTESLRRESNQREIITQPAATSQSAAEKGVASDRERSRTPAQNNANIDFASIAEQAELANSSIAEQNEKQDNQSQGDNSHDAHGSPQDVNESTSEIDGKEQTKAEALEHDRIISDLKKRDQEVRSHEAAHAAVGGAFTGAPNLTYEKGPDGKRYAVSGEVSVDLSTIKGDPSATIAKMQKVHAAALAPVNPSVQDTRVASTATQLILQAQSELLADIGREQDEAQAKSVVQEDEDSAAANALSGDNSSKASSKFEVLINKTLENQDGVTSTQPEAVLQRALRIESYYANITQAYEKPPPFKFELTA